MVCRILQLRRTFLWVAFPLRLKFPFLFPFYWRGPGNPPGTVGLLGFNSIKREIIWQRLRTLETHHGLTTSCYRANKAGGAAIQKASLERGALAATVASTAAAGPLDRGPLRGLGGRIVRGTAIGSAGGGTHGRLVARADVELLADLRRGGEWWCVSKG